MHLDVMPSRKIFEPEKDKQYQFKLNVYIHHDHEN